MCHEQQPLGSSIRRPNHLIVDRERLGGAEWGCQGSIPRGAALKWDESLAFEFLASGGGRPRILISLGDPAPDCRFSLSEKAPFRGAKRDNAAAWRRPPCTDADGGRCQSYEGRAAVGR
jgi:hypothetical protein